MPLADSFTAHYAVWLDGDYDCVDRIVLNGYFPLGNSPGGFRFWWRQLTGSDDTLDNAHLMRLAGRFSRRLRAWAKQRGVPVIDVRQGERKHEIAEELIAKDPHFTGVFWVIVGRAQSSVWEVERYGNAGLNLRRKQPYVNHYSFHILDREWGQVTIKVCGHSPFKTPIILNGHEYAARQAAARGIQLRQEGNCFTEISDARGLARCADCCALRMGRPFLRLAGHHWARADLRW